MAIGLNFKQKLLAKCCGFAPYRLDIYGLADIGFTLSFTMALPTRFYPYERLFKGYLQVNTYHKNDVVWIYLAHRAKTG